MRRQPFFPALLLFLALPLLLRAAEVPPSPPATQPATAITGTLKSTSPILRLAAVDRSLADPIVITKETAQPNLDDKFLYPAQLDPKTGAFTIPNLLPGHVYDLIAWTATARWEGVNMDYHRVVTPDQPFTDDDKKWIKNFVATEQQFANKARTLWIAADHKHATVLVELLRDTEFHSGQSGDIIYRTELWYFENLFGGWAKDRNTEITLTRYRGPQKDIPPNWQYVPQLGGLALSDKPIFLTLPDAPDKKHGLAGGL